MKTTLHYTPTNPAHIKIDTQITDWLNGLDLSMYDGPDYKMIICESATKPYKPYRTILIEDLNGYFDVNSKLYDLGLQNLVPDFPINGCDGIYVLK